MGDKDQWERLELILQQAKIRKHELASRLARVGLKKMAAQEIEFQKAIDLLLKEAQLNIAGLTVSSDNRDAAWRALDLFLGRLEALIDDLELYNSLPEDRRDMRELIYTRARIRIASLVKNLVQTTLECQRFLGLEH